MRVQESILALEQRRGNTVIVCDRAVGRVLLGYFLGTQPDQLPFLEMFPGVVELRRRRPEVASARGSHHCAPCGPPIAPRGSEARPPARGEPRACAERWRWMPKTSPAAVALLVPAKPPIAPHSPADPSGDVRTRGSSRPTSRWPQVAPPPRPAPARMTRRRGTTMPGWPWGNGHGAASVRRRRARYNSNALSLSSPRYPEAASWSQHGPHDAPGWG